MAPSRLPSSSHCASGEEATATTKVRTTDVRSSATVRPRHHRRRLYSRLPFAPPDVAATPCPYDHAAAEEDRTTGRHSIHQSPDAGVPPSLCDQGLRSCRRMLTGRRREPSLAARPNCDGAGREATTMAVPQATATP